MQPGGDYISLTDVLRTERLRTLNDIAILLGRWDRRQNLARDFSPMARRNRGMIPWRSLTKGATTPAAKSTAKNVAYPTARVVTRMRILLAASGMKNLKGEPNPRF